MMSFAFSAMVQVSLLTTGANTYADAHKQHVDTGRPMVLLVGAEWCPACVQMKNNIMPRVAKQGVLEKVAFAHVNTDRDGRVAKAVMQGGMIPQLIMYRKTPNGWRRHLLMGAQSPEKIQAFIKQGLALDEADALAASKANQTNSVSYQKSSE
ncbi:MAG TPA: thioredoxin family protein [Pirellulales bacterium]|nr:thioredoxin family protein [Pirellulales bacterium]